MIRERALQVVLVVIGLAFSAAGVFALTQSNVAAYAQMIAGLTATLGIFLLLAVRSPSANRSLITFAAWSSLVHGTIMAVQALHAVIPRAALASDALPQLVAGIALLVLAPAARKPAAV